jgi:outer membrane protein assembly factor BamB
MKPFSTRTVVFSSAVLLSTLPAQGVNWTNQGYSPGIDGFNPREKTISASNVQNLSLSWQSNTADINGVFGMVQDGGAIFVESNDSSGTADVVALNVGTGDELWKASLNTTDNTFGSLQGIAAHSGRVFAPCVGTNVSEGLCAFSATTGKLVWSENMVNPNLGGGAIARPTYAGGLVYVVASIPVEENGVTEFPSTWAFNAKNGSVQWVAIPPGDGGVNQDPLSAPGAAVSVSNGSVYTPCVYQFNGNDQDVFAGVCTYALSNGAFQWENGVVNQPSFGGAPMGMSVSGSTVYFQQAAVGQNNASTVLSALNAQTGTPDWTFTIDVTGSHDSVQPTVAKGSVYWPDANGTLWALKAGTGATNWSFSTWPNGCSPVGGTESQPQVVNGVVFISTSCSNLGENSVTTFAFAGSNGALLWSGGGGTSTASGAAPMIVNGTLYTDCSPQLCAFTLPGGSLHRP